MRKIIAYHGMSIILLTLFLLSCSENVDRSKGVTRISKKEQLQKQNQEYDQDKLDHRPAWFDEIPLVVAGGWDSEPATQRRWNDLAIDYMDEYNKRMSEETVIKLKEMGITLVITHYFKGYGIKGEGVYMDNTRRFAELCHKHGLRVGAYIGDTFCYEQFLLENPKAMDWVVPDYLGEPVRYGGTQSFRMRPYIGHPGYQDYIKKVLKKAIEEAKVDLIHFDNSCSYGLPQNFHHPLAIEQFRDFLRYKYTPDQLEDRFDFRDVKYVIPPKYIGTPEPVQDPLFQEWTDFRCWKVGAYLMDMRRYIKELNPEVVVESNPHGVTGHNTAWGRGIDWPRVLASTEVFWSEGEGEPGVRANGSMVTRIRTYKVGRILNNKSFVQLGHNKLMMAEAMAYNQNCLSYIGALLSPYYWSDETIRYVRFFHDHFQYYKHTKNIAPVAILRTFPTMAYSSSSTQYSTILSEQTLIQTKIPFNIIFDQHLEKDLSEYKVLVIADQDCMTDEQIGLVKTYVEEGGGLVITGNTSLYNEWRRRRHRLGLRDLFTEDLPYPPGTKISQHPWSIDSKWYRHTSLVRELEGFTEEDVSQVRGQYGKGRVVYIPHIKPGLNRPSGSATTSEYWKLPDNYQELEDAVRWVAGEDLPIEIKAPLHVTMEWLMQEEENRMVIHLVNYDIQNQPVVKDVSIRLKLPEGKQVKDLNIFSPDQELIASSIEWQEKEEWVSFSVPFIYTYDLLVIQFN